MTKRREEAAKSSDGYGSDFLGLLLKAHHEDNSDSRISVEDLIDECKTFYVAGHETTSSSLTWTLLLLAMHTDWQDKARNEVIELFGLQNPTPDDLPRLKIVSFQCFPNNQILKPFSFQDSILSLYVDAHDYQ